MKAFTNLENSRKTIRNISMSNTALAPSFLNRTLLANLFKELSIKESGCIRWSFGRNVGIKQRLKNYRRFIRIFECFLFSSIMITGKLLKLYQNVFCFNRAIRPISNFTLFFFKEFCCLWVLSPRIWNVLWMHFSKMNLLHQIKKLNDDP